MTTAEHEVWVRESLLIVLRELDKIREQTGHVQVMVFDDDKGITVDLSLEIDGLAARAEVPLR
jgi:hypothetical protein